MAGPNDTFTISPQDLSQWAPVDNTPSEDDQVDYSTSGADFVDRVNTQNFFDTPDTQANYLKGIGYETKPAEGNNLAVRHPGQKWGVLDPSSFNPKEMGAEILTNLDLPVQGMARTPGIGAVIGGGYEGIRQYLRQGLDPNASMEPGKIALNAAVGGLAPYLANKVLGAPGAVVDKVKGMASDAADAVGDVASKIAPETVQDGKGMISGAWDWVKNKVSGPDAVTRDISVSPKSFKQVGTAVTDAGEPDNLNNAVKYLQKNSPEFNQAMNAWSAKGKADGVNAAVSKLGPEVGKVYDSLPPISGKTITGSKDFATLESFAKGIDPIRNVAVPETTQKAYAKIYNEQLDQLAQTFLSPHDLARYGEGELAQTPKLLGTGITDETEALKYIIQSKNVSGRTAANLKQVWEDAAKFDTSSDATINVARQLAAGANREAVDAAIKRLPNEAERIAAQKTVDNFHYMTKVAKSLDDVQAIARQTGAPPLGKMLPSTIASGPRKVGQMAQKIANFPPTRNVINAVQNSGLGNLLSGGAAQGATDAAAPGMAGPIAQTLARGVGFESLKKVANKQVGPEEARADALPPAPPAAAAAFANGTGNQPPVMPPNQAASPDPFPTGLPRDTDSWNPGALGQLAKFLAGKPPEIQTVGIGLMKALSVSIHARDKQKMQRNVADLARTFPEAFEPGMGVDNKLFHPDEQSNYMDTLQHGLRKGIVSSSFLAQQRDSFLNKNDSSILPIEENVKAQLPGLQSNSTKAGMGEPRKYNY